MSGKSYRIFLSHPQRMAELCRVHLRLNMNVLPSRICPDVLLVTGKQQVLIYLQYLYTKAHPASGCWVYYSLFSQLFICQKSHCLKLFYTQGMCTKSVALAFYTTKNWIKIFFRSIWLLGHMFKFFHSRSLGSVKSWSCQCRVMKVVWDMTVMCYDWYCMIYASTQCIQM